MKTLETQRLILREWHETEIDDLFYIMKNPSVIDGGWMPHADKKMTSDVLDEYMKMNDRWAVALKTGKKVIGCIRPHPDNNRGRYYAKTVNYVLSEAYWRNGYMTEALRRVGRYAFEELNIDLLSAVHYPNNIKPKKCLKNTDLNGKELSHKAAKELTGRCLTQCATLFLRKIIADTAFINENVKRLRTFGFSQAFILSSWIML